ncbi:MAG TPA: peptide chain release factor N(5)-glutamine methyltransferase [Pseudolabrys sp.]|nr:peptide chain release factor N(5)-glutamine methyltransferase [Pseudolabrys sp.]
MRVIAGLKDGASVSEALHLVAQAFRSAGLGEADVDARVIVGHALHLDRARLIARSDRILEAREITVISALAARRLRREPVSRILGQKEFWSLTLTITPDVLVPRPETETVVEAALDFIERNGLRMEKVRVLDIGTGSGALLLALLSELPNAKGTGTDVSTAALKVARGNAARCEFESRCNFIASDIAAGVRGPFDLIVSNPPYIANEEIASLAPEVRDYDPMIALDGGNDGLVAYRAIAAQVKQLLAPGGRLFVEIGAHQEAAVHTVFINAGLTVGIARKDLAGIPRVLGAGFAP